MNADNATQHLKWSERSTFFLAATGAAVGLGNIWKFPYVAGENGGGAFVFLYLFFVLLIGIPLFMSEVVIGKRGEKSPSHSIADIANKEHKSRQWAWVGIIAMLSGFLILSYYSVVGGEVMAYSIRMASGQFEGQSADAVMYLYNNFRSSTETLLAWHTLFMVVTCIIVARGVHRGLEKTVSLVMPLLVGLLLILVANALQTDTFVNGASFLFDTDFKKLFYLRDSLGQYILDANGAYQFTYKGIMTAMGHAFFTLGVGVGTIIIYGAYLRADVSVAGVTVSVALADTVIALLAGLAIFPIVFAYGLSTAQGPGLVFTTLPVAFGSMIYGGFLGGLFYLALFFAALTSAIALIEPTVVWMMEKFRMTRVQAATWSGILCWLLGVISVFSVSGTTLRDIFESVATLVGIHTPNLQHRFFDLSGFQFIDALVTLVLLPLVGLLIAIFAGWIIRPDLTREELQMKSQVFYKVWQFMVRYITPVLVLVIFVFALQEWVNTYVLFKPVL